MLIKITHINPDYFHEITIEILRKKNFLINIQMTSKTIAQMVYSTNIPKHI